MAFVQEVAERKEVKAMTGGMWFALVLVILFLVAMSDGPVGKNGRPPRGRRTSVPRYEQRKWEP